MSDDGWLTGRQLPSLPATLRTTVDHDRDVECEATVNVSDNDAHFALVIVGGSELRSTGHFGTAGKY